MIRLTKDEILILHKQLIDRYGGTHGLRDENLLDSALQAPFQGYGEYEFYPSVVQKAVRLCYGLVMNHPFIDGNKRIGAHAMLTLLALNGIEVVCTQKELTDVILALASGEIGYDELLSWVLNHQE